MSMPQKHPLHPLTEHEERELRRFEKASSERVDVVRRARAILAVAEKQTFLQAATTAGFPSFFPLFLPCCHRKR